jgi:hypothetical protein
MVSPLIPKLQQLPSTFPLEGAIRIELAEGVPIFRASRMVEARIETLLLQQQMQPLSVEEEQELDRYEELDDYLSFLNRTVRNFSLTQPGS